jgi:hypothetical protein
MAMDIEPASGDIVWHSIFSPLVEQGGSVEEESKYLGEYSSPWQNKDVHVKGKIKTNLLVVSYLQWHWILN